MVMEYPQIKNRRVALGVIHADVHLWRGIIVKVCLDEYLAGLSKLSEREMFIQEARHTYARRKSIRERKTT